MLKRLFDFSFGLILLIVLSPFIFGVGLCVRFFLGSPVLFKQQRAGFKGRLFYLYKFRSMTDVRDQNGELLSDEKRLTKFGLFLRKTSLDELPQLWNVIKGDLSFVGPRPLLVRYLTLYSPEQARRHDVKPGITGWAQVNGRNSISWEEKFKLDGWYVDHACFLLDIGILIKTIIKVIFSKGINSSSSVTMTEFKGND